MDLLQALILGIVQGLTEFLPISSSGHLEIGKVLLGVELKENLAFSIAVHGATVLSTLVIFRKDIATILKGIFRFQWNWETRFGLLILLSMVPVAVVGLFFEDAVEELFSCNLLLVGSMLLVTALLLMLSMVIKQRKEKPIGFLDALIIGIAQAVAVLPGFSRSGATIATGLMLGKSREEVARFSFLMVIIPILGANMLSMLKGGFSSDSGTGVPAIVVGFIAAFIVGCLACKWMITLVKKGKLIWFSIYCLAIGTVAILWSIY